MRAFLDLFLALPRDLRFFIWTLFLETYALDTAQQYRITSTRGSTSDVTVPSFSHRPSRILAARVGNYHCRGVAANLISLLRSHRKGRLQHVGTILRINLHTIFASNRQYLVRTKNILMLALQLRLVTAVELQVWDHVSDHDFHYYECVPIDLYIEHIAPIVASNPFDIPIT